MGKAYYGISERTGKTLLLGDVDNFPKRKGSPWFLVITVCSIAAVVIAFVIEFGPRAGQ